MQSKLFKSKTNVRNQQGSLTVLLLAAVLIFIVGMGAFAMDVTHNIAVRTELQNATDAAALSGARDLLQTSTQNNADADAINVAAQNTADGSPVSTAVNGCTVIPQWSFDNVSNSGTVTVDGSKQINNIFAKLFGHNSDTITSHSAAQAWRSVTGIYANEAFPMAVSIDQTQGGQQPLYTKNVGDTYTLYINSQKYKNAAWTGLTNNNVPASWLTSAIDQLLGLQTLQPGFIPGLNVGESMSLGNGVSEQKQLAGGSYLSILTDPNMTLVLPCMQGPPPYNQSTTCVGFITVHINQVDINQSGGDVEDFQITIVKGIVKGPGGIPASGSSPAVNAGMTNISAGTVKLVS